MTHKKFDVKYRGRGFEGIIELMTKNYGRPYHQSSDINVRKDFALYEDIGDSPVVLVEMKERINSEMTIFGEGIESTKEQLESKLKITLNEIPQEARA